MQHERSFLAVCALMFVASAAGTFFWCRSMSGGMPMPGGWTMSMAWMRMPGQSVIGAAASFIGMWFAMMVAMMTPALVMTLSSYRSRVRAFDPASLGGATTLVAAGYFAVWSALGALIYPIGITLARIEMRWRAVGSSVPIATGALILLAGCLQLTRWKALQLDLCRDGPDCCGMPSVDARSAWLHGIRSGVRCALCCAGFTTVLLATGVMNLGTMAAVTAGITLERFAPRPATIARAIGLVLMAAGAFAIASAVAVM
jgi:predicted metal-binding membrane protein